MIIREDADIGSVVIGDIQKKSECVQQRLREAIEILSALRSTQLRLLYAGLGVEDPGDDIAEDVPLMRTLVGEFAKPIEGDEVHTPKGFVAEVQDALRCEGPEDAPLPSQKPSCCSTGQLGESHNDTQGTPNKTNSSPAPLSPDGLLCTMHSQSPCTPTDLNMRSTKGPWFQRTPTLTMTDSTPGVAVTRRLELAPTPITACGNSVSSAQIPGSKDASCISVVLAVRNQPRNKSKVLSTPMDDSQDDIISRTTHKSDGR